MERWDEASTRSLKEQMQQLKRNQQGRHGSEEENERKIKAKEQLL